MVGALVDSKADGLAALWAVETAALMVASKAIDLVAQLEDGKVGQKEQLRVEVVVAM